MVITFSFLGQFGQGVQLKIAPHEGVGQLHGGGQAAAARDVEQRARRPPRLQRQGAVAAARRVTHRQPDRLGVVDQRQARGQQRLARRLPVEQALVKRRRQVIAQMVGKKPLHAHRRRHAALDQGARETAVAAVNVLPHAAGAEQHQAQVGQGGVADQVIA